jgi:purine-binding chemotaxis protein CheW
MSEKVSAPHPPSAHENEPTNKKSQFVAFMLDGQQYAFPILQIQEIVIPSPVTRTPNVPDFVEGVCNLRGVIVPVVHLRKLLDIPPREDDHQTRTIIVNVGGKTLGCKVDTVSRILQVDDAEIHPAPATIQSNHAASILGFAKSDNDLIILLDVEQLLDIAKLNPSQNPAGN